MWSNGHVCICMSTVQWIPWCGLLFNTRTLDVQTDFSRYIGKGMCKWCSSIPVHVCIHHRIILQILATVWPLCATQNLSKASSKRLYSRSTFGCRVHICTCLLIVIGSSHRAVKLKCHSLLLDSDVSWNVLIFITLYT